MEGNDAGIQVKNLELGIEAKSMEKWYFLTCSLWLAQLAFLYNTETLALDDPAHSGLAFSMSIIIQKNAPKTSQQDQYNEGNSSVEVPSFWVIPASMKLMGTE